MVLSTCVGACYFHIISDVPDKLACMCKGKTWFRILLMENTGILHLDDDVVMCDDAACLWLGWSSARDLTNDGNLLRLRVVSTKQFK